MPPYALPRSEIQRLLEAEAQRQGLSPALVEAVIRQESNFDPQARSPKGAIGLMQLMPATAKQLGVNPYDVQENLRGGVRYLAQQQRRFGDTRLALAAYNAGPGAVEKYGGVPPYKETQGYVQRIMGALSPASAEAATTPTEDRAARIKALEDSLRAPPAAPAPAATEDRAARIKALEDSLRASSMPPTPAQAPPLGPASATAPGAPAADTSTAAPDYRQYIPVSPVEAAAEANKSKPWWQPGAGMGISTTMAILGRGTGTMVAPFTGPLAPAMPLAGEMAFSYLGRKLNVALGLEEPGTLGDVASVALPVITGASQTAQAFRNAPAAPIRPSKAAPMLQAAEDAKIPLTYGEATGQPVAKRAETYLEQIPLMGTGGFRERQQAAVKAAADTQVQAQQQALRATPWHGLAQVQAAAQQGSKQAQRVLDDIAQAGGDWNRIVQASGNLKAFRAQQVATTLYNKVGELAEPLGNVPMTKTLATIGDTLKQLRTAVVPDTETIRYLEQLQGGLQSQTSTSVSPLLDATGNAITRTVTTPGKTTYSQLRQLRSDLGDTVSDYYRGSNAVIGAKGVGSLAKVKTALEQDLDTFALQSPSPELQAAAKQADQFYKRTVVPYEDTQLARALKSDTPDEIYGKFIQRDHRDRAVKFYNALDPRGKAAVQYGMVAEAQQKALDPTTGIFSPAKFEGSLKAIQEARGVFFTGEAASKLDGLMKVMRAAERAGQYMENPPTGQRVIGAALGTGAVMAPLATAKLLGVAGGLSWLLTSRRGTALLLRAHGVGEQSLAMENVLQQLATQGARIMATEAGEGLQEGRRVTVEPGRVGR